MKEEKGEAFQIYVSPEEKEFMEQISKRSGNTMEILLLNLAETAKLSSKITTKSNRGEPFEHFNDLSFRYQSHWFSINGL
jgi:hypothetical protein